jgi:phosphohistidine phosphatase
MMRTLLLLRHAKSTHADDSISDHDRPLSERGRRVAPRMGQLLLDENLMPDTIISSTSLRTQDTADLVAEECEFPHLVQYDERLYLASSRTITRVLSKAPARARTVMIVGHNPGLEEVVRRLTGRNEDLPTTALAHIELPIESWNELDGEVRGTLRKIWRPRDLDTGD